jgi:hypothetical protein
VGSSTSPSSVEQLPEGGDLPVGEADRVRQNDPGNSRAVQPLDGRQVLSDAADVFADD